MTLLAAILALKFALYLPWCRLGLRLLAPGGARPWRAALGLAALRIAAGLAAGLLWSALLLWGLPVRNRLGFNPAVFYGGLVALRWGLWSGVAALARRDARAWLVPSGGRDALWRAGGALLSTIADGAALAIGVAFDGIPC